MQSIRSMLIPGQIAGFYEQSLFTLALISEAGDGRCLLSKDNTKIISIPCNRIVLCSTATYTADAFRAFSARLSTSPSLIDFPQLIAALPGGQDKYSLESLLCAAGQETNDLYRFALYLAIKEQPVFFRQKGDSYFLRSEAQQTEFLAAHRELLSTQQYQNNMSAWVANLVTHHQSAVSSPHSIQPLPADKRKFSDELCLFLRSGHNPWLKKLLSSFTPAVSKEKLVFLIRLALQEINPDTEMAIALSGLPVNFSPEVMQAAETISEFACHHSLTDMRELDCITIDAADTQDIDDALSMEATEQGWRLGIHISLLSWFFMPDNILEQEANKRTSSLYANQTDINMLPERLSYQLASLVQGKQRPALSLFCYFDEDFQLLKTRFQLTVIQVRHRYTYDEVDLLLDDANADNPNAAMQIRQIALAAVAHLHKRKQACRYIVENPDIQPSRRLVAECMVIFNLQAALFAKQQQLPFIYRCLENDIITQNSNDETEQYLIPGSVYTAQPVAHQAMGNSVYAQATSPLRRYADLINQRQLVANLNGAPAVYSSEFIDGIIPHLNRIRKIMHTLSR